MSADIGAATTWVGSFFTGSTGILTDIIGGAVIGAATGAVVAAVTDGDIGKGAIYGAIGGAVIGGANSYMLDVGNVSGYVDYASDFSGESATKLASGGGGTPIPGVPDTITGKQYLLANVGGHAAEGGLTYLGSAAEAEALEESTRQTIDANEAAATTEYERGLADYSGAKTPTVGSVAERTAAPVTETTAEVAPVTEERTAEVTAEPVERTAQATPRDSFSQDLDDMRKFFDTMPTAPRIQTAGLLRRVV